MDKRKVWIFDIDGTIADLGHRLHFINGKPKSWSRFFAACGEDAPIVPTLNMVRMILRDGFHDVILLSGRPEKCREDTVVWLTKQGIHADDYQMYMRPDNNTEPDTKIKWEIMEKLLAEGVEPIAIFEDRKCMVEMWREKGFFVLDVNQSGKDY